ncbi:MAG: hypothetical protein M0R06_22985 [Sphaerochaeta sp.]|jgi:hypothetical protein|nr:hypothetical protein [Sphaerochaeta sp.]
MNFRSKLTRHSAITITIIFLMLLSVTGAVLAATTLTSTHNYTVTGQELLQAVEQATNEEPVANYSTNLALDWGEVAQGTSLTKYIWIKNNSIRDITIVPNNPSTSGASITATPVTDNFPLLLTPGASQRIEVSLAIDAMATVGSGTLSLTFTE